MGYRRGRYPGNGPWSDVPPYQRPGRGAGYGGGYGRGYGRGYGFTETDPTKCARFPWLERWWWANPDETAVPPTGSEKEFLEGQLTALNQELADLKKRLAEVSKEETP